MKNIKLIVITILIVVYSSFIYANNEVVEKDGNTTRIKLLDEEDNNKNSKIKLFGNNNEENGNETNVSVSVDKIPKVDVMLSNTDNMLDTTNFKTDLIASLSELGIDTSDIEFIESETNTISTENINVSTIFNTWKKFGENGIWSIKDYKGITSIVNDENTDGITGWFSNDTKYCQDITLEFDFLNNSANYDNDMFGVILRCSEPYVDSNNLTHISGYVFEVYGNPPDKYYGNTNDAIGCADYSGLWKYKDGILAPRTSLNPFKQWKRYRNDGWDAGKYTWIVDSYHVADTRNLYGYQIANNTLEALDCGFQNKNLNYTFDSNGTKVSGEHWKFQIIKNVFKVWKNGTLICNYIDNNNPISCGSFALINNSQAGVFNNFKVEYSQSKSFSEISRQMKWRENSIRVVNSISYQNDISLASPSVITQTLNENIKYMLWGTNTNKIYLEDFIHKIDNGKFTSYKESEGSSYHKAISKTAEYIKYLIDQEYYSQYLLVGNKVNLNVSPPSMKTGAISANFPQGRWQVNHDYTYFTNNIGLSNNMGEYSPNLQCDFDKIGLYTINFDDKLLKNVYVHRMPIADFDINIADSNISLTNKSYDLDKEDIDNGFGKGIKTAKFTYKNLTTDPNTWHNGEVSTWNKSDIIVIKLEVEDFQEQKAYSVKYIGHGEPQALFNLEKQIVSNFSHIKATDTSYDPKGASIVKWQYELKKGGIFIASSSQANPQFNTTGLALGTYTLYLQVENEVGDKSNVYSKQLAIVEDLDNPFLIASPSSCSWTKKQQIDIELIDLDAGIKHYQYAFSTSKTLATSGLSSNITKDKDTIYTPNLTGKYYLSIIAEDNNGNTMQKVIGAYHIDNSCPTIASFSCIKKGANNTELIIYANDTGSGIKNFYITKTPLATNSNVEHLFTDTNVKTITSKGHYYIYVIDKVGNFEWDLSKGNVYEIASIDVDSPYLPVPSSSGGGSGGGGNGKTLFSQDYLDSLNKETDEPVIPLNPVLKANKKKKDLIDMLAEIYVDWKEQNNINDKRKFDIVDLIKAIYEDFNSSHD